MKKEFKIGIIVVVTILAAYWGINFLKGFDMFSKEAVYHAKYANIQGIEVSNPVIYKGLKVGQISSITLTLDSAGAIGFIDVAFVLSNKNVFITDSTVARIISSDLLGSRAISLERLDMGKTVAAGAYIIGAVEKDLQTQINEQILPLKRSAETLIESVEQLVGSFKAVMNEDTKNNLIQAFATIPNTIKNLEQATMTIDTTIKVSSDKFKGILSNIYAITANIKESNGKIASIISNLDLITDSIAKSNITETILLVNKTMLKTNDIMAKINSGQGTIGKLINDDQLYQELIMTNARLSLLIMDIQENPQRYINLSLIDFRKNKSDFVADTANIQQLLRQDSTSYKKKN